MMRKLGTGNWEALTRGISPLKKALEIGMMRKLGGPNKKNKLTQKSPGNRDDEETERP